MFPVKCKSIKVVDIQARGLFLARRSQRLRRTGSGYEADDFDEVRL